MHVNIRDAGKPFVVEKSKIIVDGCVFMSSGMNDDKLKGLDSRTLRRTGPFDKVSDPWISYRGVRMRYHRATP
jgi:hypothetical protein